MATIIRENLGLLNDKLTVKIRKDDYYASFEKSIKDYSKKANIPGFRKGMVPAGMIKKMYGASLFYDEVLKAVEKEMKEYLTKEKPEIFAQPLPMNNDLKSLDMNSPEDYDFPFEIGLKPEINLPNFKNLQPVFYKVKVTDQMVNDEIERLQSRYGKMSEPEIVSSEENVLNVHFDETDAEGNLIENGISKDNSLLLKYFTAPFREQLIGKKKDDSIQLNLEEAFGSSKSSESASSEERESVISDLGLDKEDSTLTDRYFKMTITKVGLVEKREMNEEFFNEVFPGKELKNEEDFRSLIQQQIQQRWDAQSRAQLHDQLYHILVDSPIEFPEEFLKKWIQRGGEKEKSPEQVETEFPIFKNKLKWTLISDKLIHENNIEVSQEELRESMRREIMQYFGQMQMDGDTSWLDSYIDRMMKDEKQVDSSYNRLLTDKLFQWLQSQVSPSEKEVTAEELTGMQHHHEH